MGWILLGIILQLIGFYALYNTSSKATLPSRGPGRWVQLHREGSRASGTIGLIVSFFPFVLALGFGAGIIGGTIVLMTVASLIIILSPLTITQK